MLFLRAIIMIRFVYETTHITINIILNKTPSEPLKRVSNVLFPGVVRVRL